MFPFYNLFLNMEDDYMFKTIATSFVILLLYIMIKLVNNIWWRPKRIEKLLRKQGIKGTSYKPFNGDISEMKDSAREAAASKAMSLNHQIVPRVFPFIHKMVQQYGEVSLCWFGRRPRLIIGDTELIRLILTNKNGHFVIPPQNPLTRLLTKGLSSLHGEKWSQRRKLFASAFLLDKLKGMVPAFAYSCCTMMERWRNLVEQQGWCELDVTSEFHVLSCDSIARTAFGSSYQDGKKIFQLQIEQAMLVHEALNSIYIPGFRFIPTKKNKRRYYLDLQIKTLLREMILKKELAMKKDGESAEVHDFLSIMLQFREKSNFLTAEDVIEDCKLLYFAGQETTATLLSWTMIVLSIHPDWQEKARVEVLEIFGRRTPDFESINRLKIVSMILYEVLRLYPPVTVFTRYTKCETRVGSISIPAGVELFMPLLLVHYDSRYWENPEEFNPNRFIEGVSKASKDQNQNAAFYPFSWGPRICPGQTFAFLEAKMALAMILQHFSFKLSPSYTHSPSSHITFLKPQHGAPIIIQRI